jgi:DNA-binding SARP family transcriptional activator
MYARGDLKSAKQLLEKAQDSYTGEFLPEEPFNGYLTAARAEYAELNTSVITTLGRIYHTEGNQDALDAIRLLTKAVPHPAVNPV